MMAISWPWYIGGLLIGLLVPLLLLIGNKRFGISSSLRHMCAAVLPSDIQYFKYDWKKERWNLFFVLGIAIGGFLARLTETEMHNIPMSQELISKLSGFGLNAQGLAPAEIFSLNSLSNWKGWLFLVLGGFLVGFGTRYAGGCTSGHSIMGLASLQWPSLVATIGFMIGGFISAWLLLPLLFSL